MRGLSRTLRRLASGLVVLVAVLVAALAIVAGVVPRLAGGGAYAVLTSSMAPGLPPGTLVVTRGVDPGDVGIGDVVTYQLVSGEPAVVTHRVVGLRTGADGALQYVTRGDANPVDDPAPVRAAQVRGTLWFTVPWVGRATVLLGPAARQDASRALAALLALVAARETVRVAWSGESPPGRLDLRRDPPGRSGPRGSAPWLAVDATVRRDGRDGAAGACSLRRGWRCCSASRAPGPPGPTPPA